MLSRTAKSGNKYGVRRALGILLSSVLAFTLLQVAPPANAAAPLFVDLVTRADDVVGGQSVLLGETQLLQTSPSAIYRLDIVLECGLLDHIGDIPVAGVTDIMGSPITWNVQSDNANFVGTPEKLEQVLDNLRIIRETGDFGYVDCPLSRVNAWLVEEIQWLGAYDPQGTASYVINDSRYPLPTLTTFDTENNLFLSTSRLNTFSNGFEVEWDQFEGSLGYTPAGYSLRYREVFDGQEQRGPWIYQRSADGRQKSLVVQDPLFEGEGPAFQYEVEVAPSVIDCDSNVLFGKFESVPFVGGFGLNSDPSLLTPNNPQMIEGEVVSQCLSPCVPTETVAFDGEKLATILKFTSTVPCTWTVPSNYTSSTVDAYVVGGGGGGGASGGGGGGGGGFETSIGLPIALDDTWTVRVGTGGVGSDLFTMRGDSGRSSSVTYPGSNGDETITALGGGGGGSKDQSGENSGGDGTYTGETLKLTFGGAGSGSQGTEGLERTLFDNKYYGDGGSGGDGSVSGSSFIDGIFASGGGGGAVCSAIDELNYPGGTSQNGGSGGYCGGNSQPGSRDGNDASANTGSGGGGGASDADGFDGAGGDGASGVIYLVHTEAPLARYVPSGCFVRNLICEKWYDTIGNQEATVSGAPLISLTSDPASNGSVLQDSIPVVQGIPSDSIVFPASVMPDNYTLFTVARYNEIVGGQYQRIFDGKSDGSGINWLSGFWGDSGGYSGVAFHGNSGTSSSGAGWLTPVNSIHDFDWVVSTDQNNLYRSNGTTRSYGDFTGGVAPDQLTINGGDQATQGGEASDFQVADIITFDRELSETEYKAVEAYLGDRYGICVSNCSPPEITTASTLDPGEVGTPYTTTIQVNDASEVFFALSPGSLLPQGLSIDEQTGVISGTPTLDADFTFTIVVTNLGNGQSSSQEFTMTVNAVLPPPPPQPPVFSTNSQLTDGEVTQPFTQTIVATSPDENSISYSVVDGDSLPAGLSLDATTGELYGTPTTAGTYTFSVLATDTVNAETAQQEFTITINEEQSPPPDLTPYEEDVDFDRFKWFGVGAGVGNVAVQVPADEAPAQVLGSGSMRAYWIPNLNADPLTDGIEILCADTPDSSFGYQAAHAEVICPEFDLSQADPGLTAQIKRNFAASDPWHQISVVLTNSSDSEAITGLIAYRIDLTSGPNTAIAMTSDGDLTVENTDKWLVTRDTSTDSQLPVSLHYFGDLNNGQVTQDDSESGAGKFWIKKFVTVPAASNQTHRFIDGFTDLTANAAGGDSGQAVIVAMKAADQLEYQTWDGASDVLTKDLSDIVSNDRDLPALRIQYDCRDFGRSAIYPVVVQNNGQPIGCDIGLREGGFSEGMGGPGEDADLDAGLYPSLEDGDKKADWIQQFRYTFPNATPRLGWACDMCAITSEGPVSTQVDSNESTYDLANGLPLGFTTSIDGLSGLDSIRILPQGLVQLHEEGVEDFGEGVVIAAFGNSSLGNEVLQGAWEQLPEYDFFYWGRTAYQGRLAFVVTWVKIPTLTENAPREPINQTPTTMQLMIVSDSHPYLLDDYFDFPDERTNSNADIIWNFSSLQSVGAASIVSQQIGALGQTQFYSGIISPERDTPTSMGVIPLVSDLFTEGDQSPPVGIGNNSGDSDACNADCVVENLLTNRLQSPVNGRYVASYRTYDLIEPIDGILAPAAPREVEVSRVSGESATISWSKPIPWVLNSYQAPTGTEPVFGYRIEYATNTRGERTVCDGPGPGSGEGEGEGDGPSLSGCYTTLPELDDDPLSATSETVTVTGSGDTERLSITIPDLDVKENYTFRVFAVYSGIDFPDDESESAPTDMLFGQEVRSAPATANEQHDSDLQIITVATDPNPMAPGAQGIAGFITGNLDITNATINGSPFAYGQTAKSIATFSGGEDSIGFDSGIVIAPLVDARTFQRGSGITETDSSGKDPSYFADPNHRTKYFESVNDFTDFLSTQESWVPGDGFKPIFDCGPAADCAEGTTVLQFDIAKPEENEFLKFEYVLAGLETTNTGGQFDTAEVYDFPDGFGLFVGDINQESSCALVPQVDDELPNQRFMSMGNALNARLATEVEFNSDLNAETVSSVMSCNFDVSEIDSQTITITMAIANANDNILSTAVFIKSESIRFEPTSITLEEIPGAQIYQTYETKQFYATGTAPTSWSAENLPGGMFLTSDGLLEGTPTETGSFNFVVTALDGETVLATQSFTIQVADVERGSEVRNVRITLFDDKSIAWEHPIGSPEDMLYDVYYRVGSDQEYVLARGKKCTEVSNDRCLDFGGNTIPVQEFTDPFVDLRDSYDANTNYQFKIVARWPDDETVSETVVTATSWRDVCLGENSCSYTQSERIANEAFWEEISYEIDEARTIQGNEDAFDGALSVYIGDGDVSEAHRVSCDFSTLDVIRDEELEDIIGHEIVCSDDLYQDLEIKLSRYFFSDEQWTRTMVEVTNNDQNNEFNGTVWLVSDLGSDSDTFYEATSSLATQPGLDPVDTWAVTSDARDDEDPILIHMLGELKDEDYSTLTCWASDGTLDEDERTRNSNSCGQMVAGHDVSVSGGATTKKAWFTGLVGYSDPLLFDSAKNRAIAAATQFEAIETPWTGDMSDFVVPSLFYEIPELTCKSREVLEEEPVLSVVLLNKQLENPDGQSNQSSFSSSTALATQLCNSAQLSTTIFDGRDGTVDDGEFGTEAAWRFGLDGADVLVLPETDFRLLNSDLLNQDGMDYLKEWVHDGGRIVMVGASQYRTELENIIGIPAGTLQVEQWQSSTQVLRNNAAEVFGGSLPVANGDLSNSMHEFDESFSDAVNLANVNATSLYGGSTDTSYFSAVTKFEIGRGQASYLSSNFEGEPNVSWNEILMQSVYGTETSTIDITESGKNWNLWRSGVYWTEMNPAASFKLGFIGDSTSLTCMNTPTNPAIRKVTPDGTEIICGKQQVQDGLVDAGVSARLSRFVFASGDWMYSSIFVTNNDRENTYENQLWFGGSQNLSSSMTIEATSLSPSGTTNLSGEQPDSDGSSEWIVASEGAGINNVHGDSTSEVLTHVFDPRPNTNHGGSNRDSWLRMNSDEIQSNWWISLESDQSISISALTGRMSYEPGCDRTAVEISKQAARTITESEGLFEIPSLRTDCESLSATTTSLSAQNSGTNVSVSWSPVATATHYELSYRVGSSGSWTSPTSIPATADTVMSTLIPGLSRSTDYEFRIRAKRMNFGSHGDNAVGLWAENIAALRTLAAAAPPTTPPSTPPPSSPQANEVAQAPAQIVPQMIAQTGPGFPARLKRGKTVKFGMTAPSGLPLRVTSIGQCKTTKITKKVTVKVLVGKKIKKKKVTVQTGWAVKATKKKGNCTVTFSNTGDATRSPLASAGTITVF